MQHVNLYATETAGIDVIITEEIVRRRGAAIPIVGEADLAFVADLDGTWHLGVESPPVLGGSSGVGSDSEASQPARLRAAKATTALRRGRRWARGVLTGVVVLHVLWIVLPGASAANLVTLLLIAVGLAFTWLPGTAQWVKQH